MPSDPEVFRRLLAAHETSAPLMARWARDVAGRLAFLGDSIVLASARYGDAWWEFGERHCGRLLRLWGGDAERCRRAVEGYCRLSLEYLRLQQRLEREGRYALSSFAEARAQVYDRPEVMDGYYLDGLSLSLVFWPNHFGIFRFFVDRFLPLVPGTGACLEVGTGEGIATEALASARPGVVIQGVDISRHALDYTRRMLEVCGVPASRVRLSEGDIVKGLDFPGGAFAAAVCGEVLEHLEDPGRALLELGRLTAPGGPIFLNIAIFAAAADHIHLFHSVDEARDLVRRAGLTIGPELALAVRPGDDPGARDVPVNYACVARRVPA